MRNNKEINNEYMRWLAKTKADSLLDKEADALLVELQNMSVVEMNNVFYRDLAFGTGGLRGIIGAGTNCINVYTVSKVTQGLSNYINSCFVVNPSVAIAYDSRIKSDVFSKTAAGVLAANGIKVFLYPELMPTPCLSFAVRELGCTAGIVITASHNPASYNGYKVYGDDGCQITTEAAMAILTEINKVDIFNDVKKMDYETALKSGNIIIIDESIYDSYLERIKQQSVLYGDRIDRDVSIVYTPLNGTGLMPVTRILQETGFTDISVVEEQRNPDGNFPTCPYPNPEIREAMEIGLQYCKRTGADLLLATDPDADRCGIAVHYDDNFILLSGNEIGLLLFDFICSQRKKHKMMPKHPVFVKTIVTTDLARKIAANYGVKTIDVLTGFKYIGEVIGRLEAEGRESDYICGFEESYGYLTGTYVRDKDAINATHMICEMFAYYKTRGISLIQKMDELYNTYGYSMNTLHSYEFEGEEGLMTMKKIMDAIRKGYKAGDKIGKRTILNIYDYNNGLGGLPKSDVIKLILEEDISIVVRPSGTEPKLKIYLSVTANDKSNALIIEKSLITDMEAHLV